MGDNYQYDNSLASQAIQSPYVSKSWAYLNDNNNGNYGSNIVNFDLSGFYNSNDFISPSEMYLEVPIVIGLTQSFTTTAATDYAVGFKSGYYNLISSMIVQYDGETIQQQTANQNFYTSFKMNTTLSRADLDTIGPTIGFYPDTPTAWGYTAANAAINASGNGINNNANLSSATAVSYGVGEVYNQGLFRRQLNTSYNPIVGKYAGIQTVAQANNELRNYTTQVLGAAGTGYQAWFITATIRLKDISSFFEKAPLTKGFYTKLTLYMNLGSLVCLSTAANVMAVSGNSINFPNGTCPIMISEATQGSANATGALANANAANQIVVSCSIAKPQPVPGAGIAHSTLIPSHTMASCRIYAPMVTLELSKAEKYILENQKGKYVEFEELISNNLLNIGAGTSFNFNVTNSITDPIGILVIPMISSTVNGTMATIQTGTGYTGAFAPFSPAISPFATEPATTSPISLTGFNVQVAAKNILSNQISYSYEMFLQEFYGTNAVNGGQSSGLNSGFVDFISFNNIYRYYYVNLERRNTDNFTPKSVAVMGTNNSSVAIDLYFFVIRRKSLVLDILSGRIIKNITE